MLLQSKPPLVTVVIATYNSSATLRLALRSLLRQDFANFEAWVVGDACTDDSEAVVSSFADPRLNWTNLSRNSGSQGAPNNEGLRRARGRYVAYLGHDDLWFPWHLSGLLTFIEASEADLAYSLSALLGPGGTEWVVGPPGHGRTYENHFVPPVAWLHRREIVEDCGLWGDHLKLGCGVDMDYSRRVYLAGKRIEFCPQLSVLKFPSWWWGIYGLTSGHPQVSYLQGLENDPEELQRLVLLEAASVLARQWNPNVPVGRALRDAFRVLLRRLVDAYGRDRWPLAPILRRRFRRMRRRVRRLRGLPPYQS